MTARNFTSYATFLEGSTVIAADIQIIFAIRETGGFKTIDGKFKEPTTAGFGLGKRYRMEVKNVLPGEGTFFKIDVMLDPTDTRGIYSFHSASKPDFSS